MTKWRFLAMVICLGCAASTVAAQTTQLPAHRSHKTHAKTAAPADDSSENWSIAEPKAKAGSSDVSQDPNLAEGRKKFFGQSTTMQGGGPATSGNTTGFTPSMGLSF